MTQTATPTYREHLTAKLLDMNVPRTLHDGLREYIAARRPVGQFLTAVLENDLAMAIRQADDVNRRLLPEIVSFLFWFAPGPCWGSKEHVAAWLADPNPPPEIYE